MTNNNYSDEDIKKAVTVDVVQTAASFGSILVISVFVPGVGWGIGAGLVLGLFSNTVINYCAQVWKDEWIDGGK